SQMIELGWPALTVPEGAGGLGMGAVELAVVVEELGRVLAPGPYLPTVTQFAPVVAEAGSPEQQERFLGGVAAGELTGTLALVGFDGVRVDGDRALGEPGPETAAAVRRAVEVATTALAVETVGAAQAIFDITLAYAKQREQFGSPIGSFQAIKHKFADMLVALERARATSYFAALTIAEDDDRRALATSTAKAAAGDCAARLAKEGIQIHGG